MEVSPFDTDPGVNSQLTIKISIQTDYIFDLIIKKFDHVIHHEFQNREDYESYFNKFDHFYLTFYLLVPKECDINCSQKIMIETNFTHTRTYY